MADARAAEYRSLTAAAEAALTSGSPDTRLLRKLRRELQTARGRDYFAAPERETASQALDQPARVVAAQPVTDATPGPRP